jgi:hypothetical protein
VSQWVHAMCAHMFLLHLFQCFDLQHHKDKCCCTQSDSFGSNSGATWTPSEAMRQGTWGAEEEQTERRMRGGRVSEAEKEMKRSQEAVLVVFYQMPVAPPPLPSSWSSGRWRVQRRCITFAVITFSASPHSFSGSPVPVC